MRFSTPILLSFMSLIFILSACGVKPKNVEKPASKSDVVYPKTYPDPNTIDH